MVLKLSINILLVLFYRQINVLKNNGTIINETRNWDASNKKTIVMRDKEVIQDYRFMPEPNLLPLYLATEMTDDDDLVSIPKLAIEIPELPEQSRKRLVAKDNLSDSAALTIVEDIDLLNLFDGIKNENSNRNSVITANLLINDLRSLCNKVKCSISVMNISINKLGQVVDLLEKGIINNNFTERILNEFQNIPKEKPVEELVIEKNWTQIADESIIRDICTQVVNNNPKLVNQYRSGKEKFFFALMGILAKEKDGRLNMATATVILKKLLSKH